MDKSTTNRSEADQIQYFSVFHSISSPSETLAWKASSCFCDLSPTRPRIRIRIRRVRVAVCRLVGRRRKDFTSSFVCCATFIRVPTGKQGTDPEDGADTLVRRRRKSPCRRESIVSVLLLHHPVIPRRIAAPNHESRSWWKPAPPRLTSSERFLLPSNQFVL